MKTDIAGSTPKFRALLSADQQALLLEHRAFVADRAAEQGGRIVQSAGDGYWPEFPSVTAAAQSAIALQEALRLAQPRKGDDRLSIRIVIGVGDIAMLDDVLIGDMVPLVVRIETITPRDEIYLTSAAHLALTPAEVQTGLVGDFMLPGFAKPVAVYRIEQRHRTHILANAYIMFSDLRGFTKFIEKEPVTTVECMLDSLDSVIRDVARQFGGTIQYSVGDSLCVTFSVASQAIAAAERLNRAWDAAMHDRGLGCAINVALHRGTICIFRSFLYGEGVNTAVSVQEASTKVLAPCDGDVFVTGVVRDSLTGSAWHDRLEPVAFETHDARFAELGVYRLNGRSAAVRCEHG